MDLRGDSSVGWYGEGAPGAVLPVDYGRQTASAQPALRGAPPRDARDAPRSTAELPPCFRDLFSFRWFNSLQSAMLDLTWSSDASLAVSAPTGAGKTVLFELAILRMLQSAGSVDAAGRFLRRPASVKAVYIAPMRAIVQERLDDWSRRFGSLGLKCMEVTGDSNVSVSDLREVDIVLTTPEKFDSVTRKNSDRGSMAFFADIALLMIDEVHTLGDDRGPALEAVVCRLKSLSRLPSLQGTPLARMRCLAVSATIPNVRDVGAWLGAPPQGCASFGDEYRATPLDITVHGYNASSNDYLFERNLKYYLFPIAARYSEGKPVLVFCASRKGAEEAAAKLAEDVPPGAGMRDGPPHPWIRTAAAATELAAAAAAVEAASLGACLRSGVGYHSAGLSSRDRATVEALFRAGTLSVLCTTSTLAQGVNLPARVVIIKGTRMYDKGGYREYPRAAILQMIGRAGRPQFDERGLGVIMCERSRVQTYQQLASGGEAVESRLAGSLAEHLNAEVVARTICDISQAVAWFKASFLWTRMCSNPAGYGMAAHCSGGVIEREANALLLGACAALREAECVESDVAYGFTLAPLPPGIEMARHYVRFDTVRLVQRLPERASLADLLLLLTQAAEFSYVVLRHNEKTLLKGLIGRVRFPLVDAQGKALKVVSSAGQKLFLLVQDALSDEPLPAVAACHSLRLEADDVLRNGARIARCVAAVCLHAKRLSAAAHALGLARACALRTWDANATVARQFEGIGPVLARSLAAGGFTSLEALDGADPRRLEAVTGRQYPFGSTLKSLVARAPRIELLLEPLGGCEAAARGGALEFRLRLRTKAPSVGASLPSGSGVTTPAVLLCGSKQDDRLALTQRLSVSAAEGWELSVRFAVPFPMQGALQVVAGVIFDNYCGRDATQCWTWKPPHAPAASAPPAPSTSAAAAKEQPPPVKRAAPAAAQASGPKRSAISHAFAAVASKGSTMGVTPASILAQTAPAWPAPPTRAADERASTPAERTPAAPVATTSASDGAAEDDMFEGLF